MKQLTLEQVIKATGATLAAPSAGEIMGVSVDSRSIKAGDLFIPLVGENFDGHDFITEAFDKGAIASLCDLRRQEEAKNGIEGKTLLLVENTQKALLDLSGHYRLLFDIPVVAVTGSVGKTTTKDMIAQVLGEKFYVLKNQGNFNNEVGVPLTLLSLEDHHEIGVVEMGMRGLGEIRKLVKAVLPKVAVITNIGISHIERLHSKENIARAKLEVLEGLDKDGIAVMNGDSPELWNFRNTTPITTLYFGIEKGDIRANQIISQGEAGTEFEICGKYGKAPFKLPLPGRHNVYNALSAIAVGYSFGLTTEEIQRGLVNLKPSSMRLEIKKALTGATVIDDTYNASPDSMKAALDLLQLSGNCRAAVLGDMLELGKYAQKAHFDIGVYSAKRADILLAVGSFADIIADGAKSAGMSKERIFTFGTTEDALRHVEKRLSPCDAVLVKASRAMKMEQITQRLVRGS